METLTKLGHPEKSRAKRIRVAFNFERAESFPYGVGLIEIGGVGAVGKEDKKERNLLKVMLL